MTKNAETFQKILFAAADEFGDVGFAGARMDTIARRAGVNKASIYYNIGDKKALYTCVLKSVFEGNYDTLRRELRSYDGPREKLRALVQLVASTIDAHPNLPRILMWEHASGGKHMPEAVLADIVGLIGVMTEIMEEGEEKGVFIRAQPFLLHLIMSGTFMFYKSTQPIRARFNLFPENLKSMPSELSGEIADEIATYLLRIVSKPRERKARD